MKRDTLVEVLNKLEKTIPKDEQRDYLEYKIRLTTDLDKIKEEFAEAEGVKVYEALIEYVMLNTRIDGYE